MDHTAAGTAWHHITHCSRSPTLAAESAPALARHGKPRLSTDLRTGNQKCWVRGVRYARYCLFALHLYTPDMKWRGRQSSHIRRYYGRRHWAVMGQWHPHRPRPRSNPIPCPTAGEFNMARTVSPIYAGARGRGPWVALLRYLIASSLLGHARSAPTNRIQCNVERPERKMTLSPIYHGSPRVGEGEGDGGGVTFVRELIASSPDVDIPGAHPQRNPLQCPTAQNSNGSNTLPELPRHSPADSRFPTYKRVAFVWGADGLIHLRRSPEHTFPTLCISDGCLMLLKAYPAFPCLLTKLTLPKGNKTGIREKNYPSRLSIDSSGTAKPGEINPRLNWLTLSINV